MVRHVAEGAGTEVPPAAEVPGCVNRMVLTELGRADEGIPVHGIRNGGRLGRGVDTLGPDGPVRERVDPGHLADLSVEEPVDGLAGIRVGCSLIALLGGHLVLLRELGQEPGLIRIEGHGLLHIHMLAFGDGLGGDDSVGVVGCRYDDGVRALEHLVVHLAVVVELLGLRIILEHMVRICPVHVGQADDVLGLGYSAEVGCATAADSDAEDVQLVAGGGSVTVGLAKDGAGSHGEPDGCGCPGLNERSPGDFFAHN